MDLKPGYKQTEVGVIPDEWETRPCSELSSRIMVGIVIRPTQYYVRQGVPALRSANIRETGINDLDLVFISEKSNALLAKSQTREGDVLTVRTGYPGTSAVVQQSQAGCNCIDVLITRPSAAVDSDYLATWINSPLGKDQVLRNQGGLAQKHFNVRDMRNLVVALPKILEQRAIAGALNDVDALLAALDRLLAKKRDVKQATMQQLLTGNTRLPGFTGEWGNVRLGDLFSFKNGLNKSKEFFGTGTPIVNYMDVFGSPAIQSLKLEGRVTLTNSELKNYEVRKGDVFFTRTSETPEEIGVASVLIDEPLETVFSGFVLRARPLDDRLDDRFKAYCFSSAAVRKQITSKASYTTRALTNGRLLSGVLLPLPDVAEQAAIAAVLSDIDAELAALEQRRDKIRALKQGMMQELLTGRTRLVASGAGGQSIQT